MFKRGEVVVWVFFLGSCRLAKANVESAWRRKQIPRGEKADVGYAIEERVAIVAKMNCLPVCIKNEESLELYHFLCSSISFHKGRKDEAGGE